MMLRWMHCQGTCSHEASRWSKQLRRIRARDRFRTLVIEPLEDRRLLAGPSIQGVEMAQVMHGATQSFFGSKLGGKGGPLQLVGLDPAYLFHESPAGSP